tara:strand:- start:40 stop:552 length:513 start_codon:yes stop_codon:yes gene_type:complete
MAINKIQSESINLADTFAFTGTVTGAGGVNTPAFMAYNGADQTIANTTVTQITFTESYDSDSAFASNTFTVPSGKAGKYWIGANLMFYNTAGDLNMAIVYVQKNGSQALYIREQADSNIWYQKGIHVFGTLDLAVNDAITVSVYIQQGSGTTTVNDGASESFFHGYKIIT